MKDLRTSYRYFAAANGYDGFREYFDHVFESNCQERIFLLKGGPGTGKSSLMKKTEAYFVSKGVYIEAFHCSSDPHSLDGLLLRHNGKSVSIVDATAPHARDAMFAGAVDTLINLGDAWNENALCAQQNQIRLISARKKAAYRKAYDYLAISGILDKKIRAEEDEWKTTKELNTLADTFCETYAKNEREGNISVRLISSFSRYGYQTLSTPYDVAKKVLVLSADRRVRERFLSVLQDVLCRRAVACVHYLSALDRERTEGFYFPKSATVLLCEGEGERVVLPEETPLPVCENKTELVAMRERTKECAASFFAQASDEHFRLEKIYTAAMDFSIIDRYTQKIIRQTQQILAT